MKPKLQELADRLTEEKDQRWKDQWELGYDAGQAAAGKELIQVIGEIE